MNRYCQYRNNRAVVVMLCDSDTEFERKENEQYKEENVWARCLFEVKETEIVIR